MGKTDIKDGISTIKDKVKWPIYIQREEEREQFIYQIGIENDLFLIGKENLYMKHNNDVNTIVDFINKRIKTKKERKNEILKKAFSKIKIINRLKKISKFISYKNN